MYNVFPVKISLSDVWCHRTCRELMQRRHVGEDFYFDEVIVQVGCHHARERSLVGVQGVARFILLLEHFPKSYVTLSENINNGYS